MSRLRLDTCLILIWFATVPIEVLSAIFFPRTVGYYLASDMDASDTFRRPMVLGYGGLQNTPQMISPVYLPYPPHHQRQPMPLPPHYRPSSVFYQDDGPKPAQWNRLAANGGDTSPTGPSQTLPNVAEQQIADQNFRGQFSGLGPIPPPNLFSPRIMSEFPPSIKSIESPSQSAVVNQGLSGYSDLPDEPESALAGFFSSNWILLSLLLVLIIVGSVGTVGFFLWRKRFGSSTINGSSDVAPSSASPAAN